MTCNKCGLRTSHGRRLCKDCAREERLEGAADPLMFECPDCGGPTLGQDVTCADCRRCEA